MRPIFPHLDEIAFPDAGTDKFLQFTKLRQPDGLLIRRCFLAIQAASVSPQKNPGPLSRAGLKVQVSL